MKIKSVFALLSVCLAASTHAGGLIVHEWGTFTSFQGGDGALVAWMPLRTSRLPKFVYDWQKPGIDLRFISAAGIPTKFVLMALQRLETPVVYFYSDEARTIDLTVNFPHGTITEWYPRADPVVHGSIASIIQWNDIEVRPDADQGGSVSHPATRADRYFTARETDSDYVKTTNETEKFLFYRGLGNFKTPLRVSMKDDFSVVLANTGAETISQLFVFQLDGKAGNFITVAGLKPGEERTVPVPRLQKRWFVPQDLSKHIGEAMSRSLAQSGLYPREATAMVNTWKDSWFAEQGLRVFYLLPRAWTDGALPMTLKPAPKDLVRVMVGRAEIFTPGLEQSVVQQLQSANLGDNGVRTRIRDLLTPLGRFAQPALWRAVDAAKLKPEAQARLAGLLPGIQSFE